MKSILLCCSLLFSFVLFANDSPEPDYSDYKIDTLDSDIFKDIFKDAEYANFKLDYYRTDGYSTGDRYWYEVIVLDSLLILNFHSPTNDDWNYVDYQKQEILDDSVQEDLLSFVDTLHLSQKILYGMPIANFSGYGADVFYMETDSIKIAGGTIDSDVDDEDEDNKMLKKQSSTISGNYEALFAKLTALFKLLPDLMKDMQTFESEDDK